MCRQMPEPAVCLVYGCPYGDPVVTEIAREPLCAALTDEHTAEGCRCARCADDALTADEAASAVTHVTDRLAVLFSMQLVAIGGMVGCEHCGGWVPGFQPSIHAPLDVLEHTACPFHRHAHRFAALDPEDTA